MEDYFLRIDGWAYQVLYDCNAIGDDKRFYVANAFKVNPEPIEYSGLTLLSEEQEKFKKEFDVFFETYPNIFAKRREQYEKVTPH